MASKLYDNQHSKVNKIPFPNLRSWMHKRVRIRKESKTSRLDRYLSQKKESQLLDYMVGKVLKFFKFYKPSVRWALYRVYMKIKQFAYRIYNRMEIVGRENVPESGAIFILNHFGKKDVILFLSAFEKPVGVFTAVGKGLSADILEHYLHFVPRLGTGKEMIEKMVRTILKKNRYFAMWPEGTISRNQKVLESFSGIIRVYATLNSEKNVIPFVPVIMQNTDAYEFHKKLKKPKKIRLTFLEPYYFPRDWLKKPEEGGKRPRELINHLMMKLARKLGQNKLYKNRVLERRRKTAKKRKKW